MDIEGLMVLTDETINSRLRDLIRLKAGVAEKYLHPKDETINNWKENLWIYIDASKENLGVNRTGISLLTDFFIKKVNVNADN